MSLNVITHFSPRVDLKVGLVRVPDMPLVPNLYSNEFPEVMGH